ncbi:helix-turn-helix domain-containing protein [Streptomyces sp. MBT49]|uniref:helix-turn-helix domain-containing protein n=1 Tax=Streptomyces TaxID=1883 RepID=UPI00190A3279|nr:helix-turn-helix transcriptional regulator [Streptomyces sp. MBT49]MBK3630453.1 helix-turn-helix domain-containing protein [Streptomyces sp. MBT49]
MGAWQPLPDGLPSEVRHFVEQLRQLKDATGLSLAALGARTAYSKSSWQRYLNAVQPPPRHAVAALCRVAGLFGAEAERHFVRWELAVEAWPRPAPVSPAEDFRGEAYQEDPTVPWWDRQEAAAPAPHRPAGRLLLCAVVLLLVLLCTAVGGAIVFG